MLLQEVFVGPQPLPPGKILNTINVNNSSKVMSRRAITDTNGLSGYIQLAGILEFSQPAIKEEYWYNYVVSTPVVGSDGSMFNNILTCIYHVIISSTLETRSYLDSITGFPYPSNLTANVIVPTVVINIKDKESYKMLWDPVENAKWTFSLKYYYAPSNRIQYVDGFIGTLL